MFRRWRFVTGVLQCFLALALFYVGWLLPTSQQAAKPFLDATNVVKEARKEVALIRDETQRIRRPELLTLTAELQDQVRITTKILSEQQIDFESVTKARDALRALSEVLDETGRALEPQLRQIVGGTDADAAVQVLRTMHDGLGSFDGGLKSVRDILDVDTMTGLKNGMEGARDLLRGIAKEVSRVWPGTNTTIVPSDIGANLRKTADGIDSTRQIIDTIIANTPKLQQSLDESRKLVSGTQEMLTKVLKGQSELKDTISRGSQLARNATKVITASAKMLALGSDQLGQVIEHRSDYEQAVKHIPAIGKALEETLEVSRETIKGLYGHERSLSALNDSLESIEKTVPETGIVVGQFVTISKALIWLVALMAGINGIYGCSVARQQHNRRDA